MKISGKTIVGRSPEALWDLLLDPEVLKRCLPGCEAMARLDGSTYQLELKVGLGLIKGRFRGEVRLLDLQPPRSYRLQVKANGTTGFIEGASSLVLRPIEDGRATELEYEGEARIGGGIAAVGARLFQGAARSFQEQFFQNLAAL
jgi:hypothetical protein